MIRKTAGLVAMMLALAFACGKDSKPAGEKDKPAAKKDLVIQYYALPG